MSYRVEAVFELVDNVSKTLEGIESKFKNIGATMQKAGGIMSAAVTAPLVMLGKASLETAIEAERLTKTLEGMAGGADEAASYITAIQDASGGTISAVDALSIANTALSFGIVKNTEDMEKLVTTSVGLGRAQGLDAVQAVGDFTTALSRNSPMILDNLGLTLKLSDAYDQYALMIDKPVAELTELEKAEAFRAVALERGVGLVEAMGGVQDDTAASMERLNAMFSDAKKLLGEQLIPIMTSFLDKLKPVFDWIRNLDEAQASWIIKIGLVVAAIGPLLVILGTVISAIGTIAGVLAPVAGAILPVILVVGALFLAWKTNLFGIRDIVMGFIGKIKPAFETFVGYLKNTGDPILAVLAAINRAFGSEVANTISNFIGPFRLFVEVIKDVLLEGGDLEGWLEELPTWMVPIVEIITRVGKTFINVFKWIAGGGDLMMGLHGLFLGIFGPEIAEQIMSVIRPIIAGIGNLIDFVTVAVPQFAEAVIEFIGNVWAEVQPIIATAIATIQGHIAKLQPIALRIVEVFQQVTEWFELNWPAIQETITQVFAVIQQVITTVIGEVVPFITSLFGTVVDWVIENWPLIEATIGAVMNRIRIIVTAVVTWISEFWTAYGDRILNYITLMWENVKLVIETALTIVLGLIKSIMLLITGDFEGAWAHIQEIALEVWENLKQYVENGLNAILGLFGLTLPEAVALVEEWVASLTEKISTFVETMKTNVDNAVQWVKDIPKRIMDGIRSLFEQLKTFGGRIVMSLAAGIRAKLASLVDTLVGGVRNAVGKMAEALGFGSPSKVMMDFGKNLMVGMALGISRSAGLVGDEIADVAGRTVWTAGAYSLLPVGADAGNITNYNLTYNAYPYGLPSQANAGEAMREIESQSYGRR